MDWRAASKSAAITFGGFASIVGFVYLADVIDAVFPNTGFLCFLAGCSFSLFGMFFTIL